MWINLLNGGSESFDSYILWRNFLNIQDSNLEATDWKDDNEEGVSSFPSSCLKDHGSLSRRSYDQSYTPLGRAGQHLEFFSL